MTRGFCNISGAMAIFSCTKIPYLRSCQHKVFYNIITPSLSKFFLEIVFVFGHVQITLITEVLGKRNMWSTVHALGEGSTGEMWWRRSSG